MLVKKPLLFLLCSIVLLFIGFKSRASHIVGCEVRYQYVSGNTYKIILNLYGDCNGAAYPNLAILTPEIEVYRDSTILEGTVALSRTSTPPKDASPVCPAQQGNTTCNNGTQVGIRVFEYAGTYTLPSSNPFSSCWRFVMDGNNSNNNAGRSASIDNLQSVIGTNYSTMYIFSTLNNLGGINNNSPAFGTSATPYFCTTSNQSFNPGTTDVNNDVLTYRVISALQSGSTSGTFGPATYNAGYPAPYRLAATATPTFSAQTGQLVFSPSVPQKSVVEYLTEEYRNGVRVGSIMREMTFVVLPCSNVPPSAGIINVTNGTLQDSVTVKVCQGKILSFNLNPTDPQNDSIDLTATGIPAGATYTINSNGTLTPNSLLTWNTTGVAPGTYPFFINYSDRSCPIAARQTLSYRIIVQSIPSYLYTNTTAATCIKKGIFTIASVGGMAQSLVIKQGNTTVKSYAFGSATITDSLLPGTYTVTGTNINGCTKDTIITIASPPLPTLTTSQTAISCFGGNNGTATVTASGGTTPYTYRWNSAPVQTTATATGLSALSYTVTVRDGIGCQQTANVTITQPLAITIATSTTRPDCNGGNNGTATATASGGTGSLTYSWNTTPVQTTATATGLSAGPYIVTVTDANGCVKTGTATVSQPAVLNASITTTNVKCFGGATGTVTATPSGGTGPYTYSWNTTPVQTTATATGLSVGPYTVTITDAKGCVKTAMATITQPAVALSILASGTDVRCFGGNSGNATAAASGGTTPYNYSWSTTPVQISATANGLIAGTYTVTVTDGGGCIKSTTVTIGQPATALSATATGTNVDCNGGATGTATATVSGGTGPYTYSWNSTPVQTTATANNLTAGSYTVTVTDSKVCTKTATIVLTQPAAITVQRATTGVDCFGGNNGTATATASGGVGLYMYSWNTTPAQTTATANNLTAGSYTVTVTDASGCIKTAAATVSQPVLLNVSTTATPVNCLGGTTGTATATPSGGTGLYIYSWNTTPIQTTATATGLNAGTYAVTVTDAKGCVKTATATVIQPPVLSIQTAATNVICFGGTTGAVAATVSGGVGPYTYSWNSTPAQTTATATGLPAGTFTVTVTDSRGCQETASVILTQPADISIQTATTTVSCFGGNNGTATATVSGGTGAYTYSWNTTPVQTTATASNLAAGAYIVTITDASGCAKTATATVSQPLAIFIQTARTNIRCFGETNGNATVVVSNGTAPYTYSWNTTPVQTTATATALPVGTFTVTVTDANSCTQTATATITQPTALGVTTIMTPVNCFGDANGTGTATATGGTTPYAYSWSTTPGQVTPAITGLVAGPYTVLITDVNGCQKSVTDTVRSPQVLLANATKMADNICFGGRSGTAVMNATGGTAPYTYLWTSFPTQTTQTAANLTAGTYAGIVTDSRGCTASGSVLIGQGMPILAAITVTDTPCAGAATGSASVVASDGGGGPYTYLWSNGATNATATGLSAGNIQVTITDRNNCTLDTSVAIPSLSTPTINAGPDTVLCAGSSLTLQTTGTAVNWQWSPANGLSCTDCAAPVTSTTTDQTYIVSTSFLNGCAAADTVLVRVTPRIPTTAGGDTAICKGDGAALFATGGIRYQWTPASGLSNNTVATPTATPETTTRYTVLITQNECFTDTFSQKVTVVPQPTVTADKDFEAMSGMTQVITARATNASSIRWTPATGLSCDTCYTPSATFSKTTTYIATVQNSLGCPASDTLTVIVGCYDSTYYIANTFTPNGDGRDDWFFPQGKGAAKIKHFEVYSRWGIKVFSAENISPNYPEAGWNGTYAGQPMNADVFLYVMEATCPDGGSLHLKGDITLIR